MQNDDLTAFTHACAQGHPLTLPRGSLANSLLHDLIKDGKPSAWGIPLVNHQPALLNQPNAQGNTPLLSSLASGVTTPDWFNALWAWGADRTCVNLRGETLVHWAATRRDGAAFLEILLRSSAPVDPLDKGGRTPLYHAVSCHDAVDVIQVMLDAGADPNAGAPSCRPLKKAEERSLTTLFPLLRAQAIRLEQQALRTTLSQAIVATSPRRRL